MGFFNKLVKLEIINTAIDAVKTGTESLGTKTAIKIEEKKGKQLDNLKKLQELYEAGVLTKKEYNRKKKEIMKKI